MKLTRRQLALIASPVLLGLVVFVRPAKALFFDLTHDPINWAMLSKIWGENISTGAKLVKEYNQLIKIYTTSEQMYQSAMYMRQSFSSGMRMSWMTSGQRAVDNYTQSKYGETAAWPQVINGMPSQAPGAWATATVAMTDVSPLMSSLDPTTARNLQAKLASIEIADGSSVKCLQTISQQRANSDANLQAFTNLGKAFLSDNSGFNSLIQQLNIQVANQQQSINLNREQSAMQNCLVENQIVQNKIERDQQAQMINTAIETHKTISDPNFSWDGNVGTSEYHIP